MSPLGLGWVETQLKGGRTSTIVKPPMFSASDRLCNRLRWLLRRAASLRTLTLPPSGGSDSCNQARFADDVHHPSEVIGQDVQGHLSGYIP